MRFELSSFQIVYKMDGVRYEERSHSSRLVIVVSIKNLVTTLLQLSGMVVVMLLPCTISSCSEALTMSSLGMNFLT